MDTAAVILATRVGAARGLASTSVRADAFVQEALRWLPSDLAAQSAASESSAPTTAAGQRILLADDNADLRDYVHRLLRASYEVELVRDGVAALEAARARPPDLIISDVMMPKSIVCCGWTVRWAAVRAGPV